MILSRIKQNVLVTPEGCWLWLGCLDHKGYGRIKHKGRSARTHIEAFAAVRGAPPPKTVLDHKCRVRHCCNPEHLEPVSVLENTLRGEGPTAHKSRQTHCKAGHPLSGDNVYTHPKRGTRECLACKRLRRKSCSTTAN